MLAQIASISRFAAPTAHQPSSFELAAGPHKVIFRDAVSSSTVVQCEGIFFFGDTIEILGPATVVYAELPQVYARPAERTHGMQTSTCAAVVLRDNPKAPAVDASKDAAHAQKN